MRISPLPHYSILVLLALASLSARGQTLDPPSVPAVLKVPAGNTLLDRGLAVGAQIYTCQEDAAKKTYSWILKAPDATLYNGYNQLMAKHFAGPTWMFKDGSRIVASKVAESEASNVKSIPWLLLKAATSDGTSAFSHVSYVQRVYTAGGLAPRTTCAASNQGTDTRSDYTAMYYFWVPAP